MRNDYLYWSQVFFALAIRVTPVPESWRQGTAWIAGILLGIAVGRTFFSRLTDTPTAGAET